MAEIVARINRRNVVAIFIIQGIDSCKDGNFAQDSLVFRSLLASMKLLIKMARAMTEAIIMTRTRTTPGVSDRSIEPESGMINAIRIKKVRITTICAMIRFSY